MLAMISDDEKNLIKEVLEETSKAITNYFRYNKEHPGYKEMTSNYGNTYAFLIYDKGFHRASCFQDIIDDKTKDFSLQFRLFAVYTLLNEKNGENLKKVVRGCLIQNINEDIVNDIERLVQKFFPIDQKRLLLMQEKLLEEIHYEENDHDEDGYWKDRVKETQFYKELMGFVGNVDNERIEKRAGCIIL